MAQIPENTTPGDILHAYKLFRNATLPNISEELIDYIIAATLEHFHGVTQQFGYWQLCPKCDGEGTVTTTSTFILTATCPVCNGAKILARPIINDQK